MGLLSNINASTSNVYISAKQACSGTISNPSTGYTANFSVSANGVTTIVVPNANITGSVTESISHYAVHIVTTDTVSVFALSKAPASSDASFYIPTPVLGSKYIAISWTPLITYIPSEAMIIGVEDNTQIEITPSINTAGSMLAGMTYTITLDEGETYMFYTPSDMTGTRIQTTDPAVKFAVLSGVQCANVPTTCTACDHIYEEILPIETWGKSFFCTPLRNKLC